MWKAIIQAIDHALGRMNEGAGAGIKVANAQSGGGAPVSNPDSGAAGSAAKLAQDHRNTNVGNSEQAEAAEEAKIGSNATKTGEVPGDDGAAIGTGGQAAGGAGGAAAGNVAAGGAAGAGLSNLMGGGAAGGPTGGPAGASLGAPGIGGAGGAGGAGSLGGMPNIGGGTGDAGGGAGDAASSAGDAAGDAASSAGDAAGDAGSVVSDENTKSAKNVSSDKDDEDDKVTNTQSKLEAARKYGANVGKGFANAGAIATGNKAAEWENIDTSVAKKAAENTVKNWHNRDFNSNTDKQTETKEGK